MNEPIAIVGMACIFPKAPDLHTFWQNLCNGVNAIVQAPPNRIDPLYYDPKSKVLERLYCRRGGFIDEYAKFDPIKYRIMPNTAASAEPDQPLALEVSARALLDAGYSGRDIPLKRTGVILGRGAYMASGIRRLEAHIHGAEQLVIALRSILPGIDEAELDRIKREFNSKVNAADGERIVGLIPNLCASRIANYYDFRGPAYTIDAACASSLLAVEQACQQLLLGKTDMMLCGGVHLTHFVSFWAAFSQLNTLSRSQMIRPFDTRADGTLLGEGVGILALRRERDAVREGQRIYARIRGIGSSSDGGGQSCINPNVEGQLLALQNAWRDSDLQPDQIGMLEAHGTGTRLGDSVEVETLRRFFGSPTNGSERAGLGTVKSMIGHTMPASGAAGLIKATLAVYHAVRPCSLNSEKPLESLQETRFRVLHETEPWEAKIRIAGVNTFGFGGINAHVLIQNVESSPRMRKGIFASEAKLNGRIEAAESARNGSRDNRIDLSLGGHAFFAFDKPLTSVGGLGMHAAHPRDAHAPTGDKRLEESYNRVVEEMLAAQSEVLTKFAGTSLTNSQTVGPEDAREPTIKREISLRTMPELIDHSFYRQAEGWSDLADLQPLVPMTGLLELIRESAQELAEDRKVIGIENLRAHQWLRVDKPVYVDINCVVEDAHRIAVTIDRYAEGVVVLADAYPEAPRFDASRLSNQREAPISADEIYCDHWLFHGPLFQGVKTFGPMADDGMWGEIEENGVRGALLDCAGQIFGLWVAFNTEVNRVALPIRINRITFYKPFPPPGTLLQCKVRVREVNATIACCDMWISRNGEVITAIEGWQDLRLPIDENLFELLKYPENKMLCTPIEKSVVLFHDTYTTALGRDTLANRYLREAERQRAVSFGPRGKRAWTNQCIAAKDAVRQLLWSTGEGAIFPAEIWIDRRRGKPMVLGPAGRDLRVSSAQDEDFYVAIAAFGNEVGIAIEKIDQGAPNIEMDSCLKSELELLGHFGGAEALARLISAKRAYLDAQGLNPNHELRAIPLARVEGHKLLVVDRWVETVRYANHVIGFVGV